MYITKKLFNLKKSLPKTLQRNFSTLLIAETIDGVINPGNYNALAAAVQIGEPIDILMLGDEISLPTDNHFGVDGAKNLYIGNNDEFKRPTADVFSTVLKNFIEREKKYTHVLAMSSTWSKDYLPRLAGTMDCQAISDITSVLEKDIFVRTVYAGNAFSTVKSTNPIHFLTVRATSFDPIEKAQKLEENEVEDLQKLLAELPKNRAVFEEESIEKSERPDLGEARFVVSGGRGLQNGENFKLLEDLADVLGQTAIGASRAAVDAGYCSNDMQIGQTGKIVAPELYIAVGISGAIQHLAGMKDSKVFFFYFRLLLLLIKILRRVCSKLRIMGLLEICLKFCRS